MSLRFSVAIPIQISCVLGHFSSAQLFAILWTVACQAPLSVGCSRQECWSGVPYPAPGDLPSPGTEPVSFRSLALAGGLFTARTTWEILKYDALAPKGDIKCLQFWPFLKL